MEILRSHAPNHPSRSPDRSVNQFSSNLSFLNDNASQSNRSTSRDAKNPGLPLLNPQLNINDITYSIKEKITINTAPNKQMGNTVHNFNLYLKSPAQTRQEEHVQPMSASIVKPLSRDPKNDFRRATDRAPTSSTQPTGVYGTTTGYVGASKNVASRSYDFENKPPPQMFSQTSKKFKTTQGGGSMEYYSQDARGQSQDSEPKSRKLLEMMLKRISRLSIDEVPNQQPAPSPANRPMQSSGSGTGSSFIPRFMTTQRQSIEMNRPTLEAKSTSMDHNKKKISITMTRNQDSSSNHSRRNSREPAQSSMMHTMTNNSSLLPTSKLVSSTKQQKHINIRPVRMRNPPPGTHYA